MFFEVRNDGSGYKHLIVPAGAFRNPSSYSSSLLKQDIDNNFRTDDDLFMNGAEIFNFAINKVPELMNSMLNDCKLSFDEFSYFVFHQANEFMVNHLAKKIGLDIKKVPIHVKEVGNTGPASIPLTLCSLNKEIQKPIFMCGFGVGLSWAGLVTNIQNCKIFPTINYE